MFSAFFDKLEKLKRERFYRRSQRLRLKNEQKPPNHQGWGKMIDSGAGGLNRSENILAQKEFILSERKKILDDNKEKETKD